MSIEEVLVKEMGAHVKNEKEYSSLINIHTVIVKNKTNRNLGISKSFSE